jgi:hypothetical protein
MLSKPCLWGCVFLALLGSAAFGARHTEPCILFSEDYGERLESGSDTVALWWASSGWKVARDRTVPTRTGKAVWIELARNEREAAQLVVQPGSDLTGFTATAGPLTGPGGSQIPAECVEVLRVRYVTVERPSDGWGASAPWPDPLPPFQGPLTLSANKNQPLWIRVYAPKGTPAGVFEGTIALRANSFAADIPLHVRVYGFELPDRATCTTAFGFNANTVYQYQGLIDPEAQRLVLDKYWASFRDHRITPYCSTPGISPAVSWTKRTPEACAGLSPEDARLFQENALTPVIDWADWDREMQRTFDTFHFNSFRLGIPGINAGEYQGFPAGSSEYELAFNTYGNTVQEHLREKGLLDEAYIYWYDEPAESDYPAVMQGFRQLQAAVPDIALMLTEQIEPGLIGGPNLWCPLISAYNHEKAEARRNAGEHFWWYVCTVPKKPYPGLFIDHPATDLRAWLWQTWMYGIEGILIWHSNLWTTGMAYPDQPQNPYEDTMSWMTGYGTKPGEKRPWGNGDGRFMYPPEAAADAQPARPVLDGPVDSIRWEMLRDGVEDYEYLVLLKQALDNPANGLSEQEKARCRNLLEVPEAIARDARTYTKDPAPIEKQRTRIARVIEKLAK